MELHHTFAVPAAPQTTWDHLMDIAAVAECFPGATVTSASPDGFTGLVKVKLGPIALQYAGSGTFVERDDEAHEATLRANGKDKRGNGTAGATVRIALAPDGDGTSVDVATDLAVTGKPAQFGRGVMQDVSDKLLGQFVSCLEKRLAEQDAPDTVEAPAGQDAGAVDGSEAAAVATAAATAGGSVPDAGAGGGDVIDLGSTVLPVILRSYAPYAVVALLGLVVGILLGRRRHH